jgi:hypothetical protein
MLRALEDRVLRKVLASKKNDLTLYWRRLQKEELPAVCSTAIIIWVVKSRTIRWAGNVARTGKERGLYWILVGRTEARRPLGIPSVNGMDCGGNVHWIDVAQDRESGGLL